MKVLLITLNFSPEITGTGKYSGELAFWLSKQCDVRVITTHPYNPVPLSLDRVFIPKWTCEIIDGVRVYRCPLLFPFGSSAIIRICHLAIFAICSLPTALWQIFWRPNIVIVVQPTFFSLPIGLVVSRLVAAKSVLHIQDFELDAAFSMKMLSGGFFRRIAFSIEQFMMKKFSMVATISEKMIQLTLRKGVDSSKIFFLPNWINFEYYNHKNKFIDEKISTMLQQLGIPKGSTVALYSGSMGRKQGLSTLAHLSRLACVDPALNLNPVHFIFCGDGPFKSELIKECEGIPNVSFMNFLPYEDLVGLFNLIDIHLLPQRADIADLVLPSKLSGMLASGKPVIATAKPDTELAKIVSSCGLVVEPNDINQMLSALIKLANDRELRNSLGAQGKLYAVQHLERESVLSKFYLRLRELVCQ